MIGTVERVGRALARLEGRLIDVACLLLVLLLVLINVEVAGRYVFSTSTLIADEYGGYLFAWIVLLGAVNLLRSDRYLTMTWLVDRLPAPVQNMVGIVSAAIGLAVSAVALYATAMLTLASWRFGSVSIQPSATPLVWVQIILPAGYALLCLVYVEEILRRLLGLEPRRNDDAAGGIG